MKNETVYITSRLERLWFHPNGNLTLTFHCGGWLFFCTFVFSCCTSYFICEYIEENGVFYGVIKNDEGRTIAMTSDIISTWNHNWVKANNEFEDFLKVDADLRGFSNKCFLCGIAIIDCKCHYQVSTKTMQMILNNIFELKTFFSRWRPMF